MFRGCSWINLWRVTNNKCHIQHLLVCHKEVVEYKKFSMIYNLRTNYVIKWYNKLEYVIIDFIKCMFWIQKKNTKINNTIFGMYGMLLYIYLHALLNMKSPILMPRRCYCTTKENTYRVWTFSCNDTYMVIITIAWYFPNNNIFWKFTLRDDFQHH